MSKRLIWVDGDKFTGWCCSQCMWGLTAPRLESTVAALAFNRLAQEDFEKHDRTSGPHGESRSQCTKGLEAQSPPTGVEIIASGALPRAPFPSKLAQNPGPCEERLQSPLHEIP